MQKKGVAVMKEKCIIVLGKFVIISILIALLTPQTIFADSASDAAYEARIKKLENTVEYLVGEIGKLKAERVAAKAAPSIDQTQIRKMVDKAIADSDIAPGDVPQWVKNMQWFGDFRYRHEEMDETASASNKQKQKRNRIRARLGLKAKVNEDWDLTFRIATGSSDSPTSTNQTLGDSGSDTFGSKDLWLDLAYATWHPASHPDFTLYAGKMKNPFFRAGGNQLIWNGDVTPEGGAIALKNKVSDNTTLHTNAGAFWIRERTHSSTGTGADTGLFGLQGYAVHKFHDDTKLTAGASLYSLTNIDDEEALGNQGTDSGNGRPFLGNTRLTANGPARYQYGYDMIEGFAEYAFHVGAMPVSLFGNVVKNSAAVENRDTGWLLGFKVNKAKKPGSWQFSYDYRNLESDAVFAGLSDSDFLDGGTDGKGHKLGFKYQIAKNLQTGLTYFCDDRRNQTENREDKFRRLQWDLIFKFK